MCGRSDWGLGGEAKNYRVKNTIIFYRELFEQMRNLLNSERFSSIKLVYKSLTLTKQVSQYSIEYDLFSC